MRAFALALLLACDAPGAAIDVTAVEAKRLPDARVEVDVELSGREGLGGNVGVYCTRVTFPGQDVPVQDCRGDLEDGDTRTARFTSDVDVAPGAMIAIRVRLGPQEVGRLVASPPR